MTDIPTPFADWHIATIIVPAFKRPPPPRRRPGGRWVGRIISIEEPTEEKPVTTLTWRFADHTGRKWDVTQVVESNKALADTLVDVGLAGRTIALAAALNREAVIHVRTIRGFDKDGYPSAGVVATEPLPPEW